jgi:acetyl-CoA C-acetyltransferase
MSARPSAREAVIVDVLRSPIGRAHKGALVDVRPDDLAAHIVRELLARNPAIDPGAIGDVICGCAFQWGEQGYNVGRSIALLAGLPHHVPAQTITHLCASSLQALRSAAHTIAVGEADLLLAVGVESVSRVGRGLELAQNNPRLDPEADGDTVGAVFMPMGLTARMGIAPIDAIRRALGAAGLTIDDLEVIELNEAFAPRSSRCSRRSASTHSTIVSIRWAARS